MGFLRQRRRLSPGLRERSKQVALAGLSALALGLWLGLSPFGVQGTGSPSSAVADVWNQFRGNPALTGTSDSFLPDSLKLLWTLEVGESIESSAAIADGVVYVGSQSGDLLAVTLSSGEELWRYRATKFGIGESSPCVGQGLVYIGDLDGVLHAVDVRTGKAAWTFATEGEIRSSPVLVGNRVLVGSYDSHLYALEADTGRLLWKVMTEGYVHSTPSVADGVAYVSGCDEIFRAIRVKDGQELYQVPSIAYTGASPALAGDAAYFGTFSNQVVSVGRKAREVLWRYESKESQFPFYSSAAVVGGRVVLGGRDRKVHCLEAATGQPLWTFATRARVDSSPVAVGDRIYVGSNDGRFYVLKLTDGKKIWEFNAGAPLSASPAVAGGRIVIGSQDGQLFCFG